MAGFPTISKSRIALTAAMVLLAALSACRSAPEASAEDAVSADAPKDAVSGASPAGRDMPPITADIDRILNGKRVLVVYFSQGNATRRVAEDLAEILGADTERIEEKATRSMGFFGFMGAGADSSFGRATPIEAPKFDPALYDGVIVCTPVWAWRLAPPVRGYLAQVRDRLPARCVFVTVSGDTAPDKIVAMMEKASGKTALAFAGFGDKDFDPENRATYVDKLGDLVGALR